MLALCNFAFYPSLIFPFLLLSTDVSTISVRLVQSNNSESHAGATLVERTRKVSSNRPSSSRNDLKGSATRKAPILIPMMTWTTMRRARSRLPMTKTTTDPSFFSCVFLYKVLCQNSLLFLLENDLFFLPIL